MIHQATLCDPRFQAMMKARGDDPQRAMTELYPEMINRAFANRPPSLHLAMHLCRGNNQSGWFGEGGYDPIADVLFNRIHVDSDFLEYKTARAGNFEPLRFVPKNKTIVLGLVSSKLPHLEPKDLLKRRIEEASQHIESISWHSARSVVPPVQQKAIVSAKRNSLPSSVWSSKLQTECGARLNPRGTRHASSPR
jgi:methionine synthase II (cobalamin-independent)